MTQPTVYRIEFGKVGETYPVPPITLEHTDPNEFARKVVAHAIPYLTPVLTAMGRPELADCFFQTDLQLTAGQFMWVDLAGEKAAKFCPARLTPATGEADRG